ncbi:MAG: hypothetical protein VX999_05670 [Candidatus Thermoplasmatota archaeon]|nr:hypothetical protein [Candidatus Thermoplasmatota archaeon]
MDDHDHDGEPFDYREWLETFRSASLLGKIVMIIFTTFCISVPIWIVWNDPSVLFGK